MNDAKREAYRIVIEILGKAINEDALPIASLEPDMRRAVQNAVVDITDQLWDEYHELTPEDAMKIFDKLPYYKD